MKFHEIKCPICGMRFNPPDEIFSNHSNVNKIILKGVIKIVKHEPVIGKLKSLEIDVKGKGKFVKRCYFLDHFNTKMMEVSEDSGVKRVDFMWGEKKLTEEQKRMMESIFKKFEDQVSKDLKIDGTNVELILSDSDYIIENKNGKKVMIIIDHDHVDIDGNKCLKYRIEFVNIEKIPIRGVYEKSEENGRIVERLKCPNCGHICVEVRK